jgi:hypothetical protein
MSGDAANGNRVIKPGDVQRSLSVFSRTTSVAPFPTVSPLPFRLVYLHASWNRLGAVAHVPADL